MITNPYFRDDVSPFDYDGRIKMQSIPGKVDWMELTAPLPCGETEIPAGFQWNGASVGMMRKFLFLGFPKWKHPKATCRHDMRCNIAHEFKLKGDKKMYKTLRKFADDKFRLDVAVGGTWWEKQKGYIGVRIGAFF